MPYNIKVRSELVAARFNNYLQELWAIDPKIEFADVVRSEAASVMIGALQRTYAADKGKIQASVRDREWVTFGGKRYHIIEGRSDLPAWHLPDTLWGQIEQYRQNKLAIKLAARGMSKQSWYLLAQKIRPVLQSVPAYVIEANYKGRQYPEDSSSLETNTPAGYLLTVLNSSPVVRFANGGWALLGAMQGRVSFFRQNMKHRSFQTQESRARKYPGIWVAEAA